MKKENTIQTILIDPFDQSVSYVDISSDDIQDYYNAMQCSCFDIVSLGGGVIMYVDDEGLLKDNMYFSLGGSNYAGRSILANDNGEGGTIDCGLTIEEVLEKLEWLPEGHVEEPFMKFIPIN
jgi:hypothetical protein